MLVKKFTEKKLKENNGILSIQNIWKSFFIENGYNYIVFGNPTECPWGSNWGNCIITKDKPLEAYILQMKSYGKEVFDAAESRNMILIKIDKIIPEYICTTHLDNVEYSSN